MQVIVLIELGNQSPRREAQTYHAKLSDSFIGSHGPPPHNNLQKKGFKRTVKAIGTYDSYQDRGACRCCCRDGGTNSKAKYCLD